MLQLTLCHYCGRCTRPQRRREIRLLKTSLPIPVVDIAGFSAICCEASTGSTATKLPPPIFLVVAVSAVHTRQHLIRRAHEVNSRVIVIHVIVGPFAVIQRGLQSDFTAFKLVSAIFFVVAVSAVYAIDRFVRGAFKVQYPIVVIVVVLLEVSYTIYIYI